MTRVVVVTGGGKGIGKAVVEHFVAAGDRVVAVGRDPRLEGSAAAETGVCDVTDEGGGRFFERVGPIDVLVNNAGARPAPHSRIRRWTTGTRARRQRDRRVPLHPGALGGMVERGTGRIVTVASTAARVGLRYAATRLEARCRRPHARRRGRGRRQRRDGQRRLPDLRADGDDRGRSPASSP